ncbi:MAG: hypothetical protein OEZ06_10250 [Myxococcales bacterium]|nr:hypothetical protein [Myxococcales bacterium]
MEQIGAAGGRVEVEGARLEIPAGALERTVEIVMIRTEESPPEGQLAFSPVYRLEPSGLRFLEPAELSIDYQGASEDAAFYFTRERRAQAFEIIESRAGRGQRIASIHHFSGAYVGHANPCGADLLVDNENCGSCGVSCNDSSHIVSCREGRCVAHCEVGRGDCDADYHNGCEADLRNDRAHCGACGNACDVNASCRANKGVGVCACNEGFVGDGFACQPEVHGGSSATDAGGRGTDAGVGEPPEVDAAADAGASEADAGPADGGGTSTPVDECELQIDSCHAHARCIDAEEGYRCHCNPGYAGDGFSCADVDECREGTHGCAESADCVNVDGGFECHCRQGYRGDGVSCNDVDECADGTDACSDGARCDNTQGGYECRCLPGYVGDGVSCEDVDECHSASAPCGQLAECINTAGAHECRCLPGYEGDGWDCQDVDECATGSHGCDVRAVCENTQGDYSCICQDGYEGDGFSCQDVDECERGFSDCHSHARCENLEGTFDCACELGYEGDGRFCADGASTIEAIYAGGAHTCARMDTGLVRCWGWGIYGELGYGNTDDIGDDELAADVGYVPVGGRVVDMGLGVTHGCALIEGGSLRCWGRNHYGPLGYGHNRDIGDDELPDSAGDAWLPEGVVQVAGGGEHTCALFEDGSVRCWGLGIDGQLGYAGTESIGDDETPLMLPPVELGGPARQVCAGRDHSCALIEDGSVRCWGRGQHAPLGLGHLENVGDDETPEFAGRVEVGGEVMQLVAGWYHSCALMVGGAVRCWGFGRLGALGYASMDSVGDDEVPAAVGDVPLGAPALQLVAGTYHTCALLEGGAVRCWGRGQYGPLGYGNVRTIGDDETPESAGDVPLGEPALQLAAGSYHTCALLAAGRVRCWGKGEYGRLGCGMQEDIGDDETPAEAGDCESFAIPQDECASGDFVCDDNADCIDEPVGYSCRCRPGYRGDGASCQDVDECQEATHSCDDNGVCENTIGSFTCICIDGFESDGLSCLDIDECALGTHHCDEHANCSNTAGGFDCECHGGYFGDGRVCQDLDECLFGTHGCHEDASCHNLEGSYQCSCNQGFVGDGLQCSNIDECALGLDDCHALASCENTRLGFSCSCPPGYEGDGTQCTDVDECALGLDGCPVHCSNLPGGFECIDGEPVACPTGFAANDQGHCVDVDECADGTSGCSADADCQNTVGGCGCSCKAGFVGDGFECEDIDECASAPCAPQAVCTNLSGGFACECNGGYVGDGSKCVDVDECALGVANCHANASCENTPGDYRCICKPGYYGDGQQCADADQCAEGTHDCDINASCTDLSDGYLCECNEGYEGDGTSCSDVDECARGLDGCDENALCTNVAGGCECSCRYGYEGDGFSCKGSDRCSLIDDFEVGPWPSSDWKLSSGQTLVLADAAHDGALGLAGECQLSRNNGALFGQPGDRMRAWVRVPDAAVASFGVGQWDEDALVFAIDAGRAELRLERHGAGEGPATLDAVTLAVVTGSWVSFEVSVPADGVLEARVLGDDGQTAVGELTVNVEPIVLGGVALGLRGGAQADSIQACAFEPLVDECAEGTHECAKNATCHDALSGYECRCLPGYEGDGRSCSESDECVEGSALCDADASCVDLMGGFECQCQEGYSGDGFICNDIDECAQGSGPCAEPGVCKNLPGSYRCLCPDGYETQGDRCVDLDECELGIHLCATGAQCSNTPGGYDCSCREGYEGDGFVCQDIDECALGLDDCHKAYALCTNEPGSYSCSCEAGFEGDGIECVDLDECALGVHGCDPLAECHNSIGSYSCHCPTGTTGNGFACEDIDECALGLDSCSYYALCINNLGSYTCDCFDGYYGDGFICDDVDECAQSGLCNEHAACVNMDGGFVCDCNRGYFGDGFSCEDLDECALALDDCHALASCSNVVGGFECSCPAGYQGDGTVCSDVDECTDGSAGCDPVALCENLPGHYACSCPPGYEGDGSRCADIDECALGSDQCSIMATCVNEEGGYSCDCGLGFGGDGYDCIDIATETQKVVVGWSHSCALMNEGVVRCWGSADKGRLGYGNLESIGDDESPWSAGHVNIGEAVFDIEAGGYHSCVLLERGRLRCWGAGARGQLGTASTADVGASETPAVLGDVAIGGPVRAMALGRQHSCVLLDDGAVRCFGDNSFGQLGYGHVDLVGDDEAPEEAGDLYLGGLVRQLVAGGDHSCALLESGEVRCWGDNSAGQLGYGHRSRVGDDELPGEVGPVQLPGQVVALAAGDRHSCALLVGGGVSCWGHGGSGRLGYGNTANVGDDETPVSVGLVDLGEAALSVHAGGYHSCAMIQGGGIRCWGLGTHGESGLSRMDAIGDNESPSAVPPVEVGVGVTSVSTGLFHSCVVTQEAETRCWGANFWGELGYGDLKSIGDDEHPAVAGDVPLH